jgi:hypothetical protein
VKTTRLLIAIVVATVGLGGCAVLGLTGAAVGGGAFSAGAGAAVEAGKEYTRGGVVLRTFSLPLHELRLTLGDALERMELAVITDEVDGLDRRITARARDREIDIRLQPVTRTVTRLRLVVAEGAFRKDRATASEIVTQVERGAPGSAASSLARDGRR